MLTSTYQIIDLTHTITEDIPTWPDNTKFSKKLTKDYPQGCRVFDYSCAAGTGTHIDAPSHLFKEGKCIHQLDLHNFIVPACVLNVTANVAADDDYQISANDIEKWEKEHGLLPKGALLLAYTGWAKHWTNGKFYNFDANGVMHFPGFGKDAAELIVKRGIVGVGIDTLSIDPGNAVRFHAHEALLGNGLYHIENLAELHQLPATGSIVFALPMKIKDGAEAPARVIAIIQ